MPVAKVCSVPEEAWLPSANDPPDLCDIENEFTVDACG